MDRRQKAVEELIEHLDSAFFAALAEPVRITIIREMMVLGEPSDINTIAAQVEQDRSGVSRHLKALLEAGIVRCHKDGRHRYYEIDGGSITQKLETLLSSMHTALPLCCPGSKK